MRAGSPTLTPTSAAAQDGAARPWIGAELPPVGAALLAAALALPGPAHAESPPERGLVSLKVLDYLDSQPGKDRIRVRAPSLLVVAPSNGDWSTSGTLTWDAISGASPAYHSGDLKPLTDYRRAAEADP